MAFGYMIAACMPTLQSLCVCTDTGPLMDTRRKEKPQYMVVHVNAPGMKGTTSTLP